MRRPDPKKISLLAAALAASAAVVGCAMAADHAEHKSAAAQNESFRRPRSPEADDSSSTPPPPPPAEYAVAPTAAPVKGAPMSPATSRASVVSSADALGQASAGAVASRGRMIALEEQKRAAGPQKAAADNKDLGVDADEKEGDGASEGGTFVHAGTNPFVHTAVDNLSTFAADVDTGSFTFARRFLRSGQQPPQASVRVEEWVNAMGYAYAAPRTTAATTKVPFAVHAQGAPSPLSPGKHVVRVALKGREVARSERAPTSLVFLVDVSGSMGEPDKLPLAQQALHLLVNQLREDDAVGLATYAGATRLVLPLTTARSKSQIHAAIDALMSGGGTNMGSGMEMAYREATKGLGGGRSARVIVLSDGDANIGHVGYDEILKSVKGYVSEGVMMSTVGFGTGNYNDHLMEQLADAGNGNYSYIDSLKTAEKVFVASVDGTLETIAQDVKIQVEWNKDTVKSYRLLGYENRDVVDEDFRNDKKDAGEVGAGHAVTALYEVELFQPSPTGDLGTVRIRAKAPRGTRAEEMTTVIHASDLKARAADLDDDGKAAVATALAAEILRGSPYAEGRTLAEAAELLDGAAHGRFADERHEFAAELRRVEPHLARR
jgi:Ca-activated chloride channel family protein